MAEKKEHKIVSATTGSQMTKEEAAAANLAAKQAAAPVGSSTPYRIGAIVLWLLAIGCEVLAVLSATSLEFQAKLRFLPPMWLMIVFLVLDLVFLIIGSQLWKKANHIKPASEKNKTKFWLWNNMGLIMTILCFVPFIVLLLTNKNADKKMKVVGVACAAIMLIIGGLLGYEWNAVSSEQKEAAMEAIPGLVFWTNTSGGTVYHTHEDCQHLDRTEELVQGNVEQAIAANRIRLCKTCARRDSITTVLTDDATDIVETQLQEEVTETTIEEPAA